MRKAAFPSRAWRLLRVALLWARRGGAFKRGIFVDFRLARGYLKGAGLRPGGGRRADRLRFGEREFSIEDTPIFRFKTPSMRLLRIPCITPAAADLDDDFIFREHERCSYSFHEEVEVEEEKGDDTAVPDCQEFEAVEEDDDDDDDDDGIDMKAEEFIAKFYEQMKMQRQMSWIQY